MNAVANYAELKGQQTNLFKCFLPQAWQFGSTSGVSAFVHPDGVFDDSKGAVLRKILYPKLKQHFQFLNEKKLFDGVSHNLSFSLNVYSNMVSETFDAIFDLFEPSTIEECYSLPASKDIGLKDNSGNWNLKGAKNRIVTFGEKELLLSAKLFDNSDDALSARLPVLHSQELIDLLHSLLSVSHSIADLGNGVHAEEMWHETNSQKDGTIQRNTHFAESPSDLIYSGPNITIANATFKSARRKCSLSSDYDPVDLTQLSDDFLPRCNYSPKCSIDEYFKRVSITPWNTKYCKNYRIIMRRMLSQGGERTLVPAICPPLAGHIHTVFGLTAQDKRTLALLSAEFESVIMDCFIKITRKYDVYFSTISNLPIVYGFLENQLIARTLLLNCVTKYYNSLWSDCWNNLFVSDMWSKSDPRLDNKRFSTLTSEWTWDTPLRTDYERRQALVEIDVLTAMALGMTLEQLKTIYRIQFPVLQQYEADTWYDANGRIVFTTNRSLVGVGFDRKEWEGNVKGAPAGKVFTREIEDDTMPGGPIKRMIEYVAPFDKCDREQDYETAWKFFEKKYGK